MTLVLYSPGRATQLRILLWVAVVLGAILAGLSAWFVVAGGPVQGALFGAVPAALIVTSSAMTLKRLEERGRPAKVGAVGTGLLLVVVGLLLARAAVGIVPSVVGILLLLFALLPDVGDH